MFPPPVLFPVAPLIVQLPQIWNNTLLVPCMIKFNFNLDNGKLPNTSLEQRALSLKIMMINYQHFFSNYKQTSSYSIYVGRIQAEALLTLFLKCQEAERYPENQNFHFNINSQLLRDKNLFTMQLEMNNNLAEHQLKTSCQIDHL